MIRALLVLATLAAVAIATIGSTGASFSATRANTGNSLTGAPDWIAPTVSLADPGANLRATVPITASASDAGSGVGSVTIQRSPAGAGTWTAVCTKSSPAYTCSLDTAAGATPDGLYDFRATALDVYGNPATSATVAGRRIDNTVPASVTITDPGTPIAGTKSFSGGATDTGGSGMATLAVQYKPSAGSTWVTACSASVAPYSCSFDTKTAATPDGLYDFRTLATDVAGNTNTSTPVTSRRIDNTGPTVAMTDPGAGPFSGSKALAATASDGGSGVAAVSIQYRPSSGGLWLEVCSDPSNPYGCTLDTTQLTDGLYDFQAVATDVAGNATTSTAITNRRIDNVAPTVTMNDPGQYLRGTVSLTAAAFDAGGLTSVVINRRATGVTTWSQVCSTNVSPYSCSLNTALAATPDGTYEFQAVATDNATRQTNSNIVTARRIDNTAPGSVTITPPGTPISGTKALTGSGTDGGSGIATIALQYSPTGQGSWTTACSGATSPTTCNFDTTTISDGVYDFRTLATDRAGNSTASAIPTPASRIDNFFPTVTMNDPGQYIRGTITASATAADGGGIASVTIQYKSASTSTWSTVCTVNVAPYQCSVASTGATDGLYDFRAVATDNASKVTNSNPITNRRVDNTAPTGVTMTLPPSPMSGNVTLSGAASDAGSGIATVDFQYLVGSTWTTACTATVSPYSCVDDTTAIADGSYQWRALATDAAGGQTASTTTAARTVDNNAPTVTMTDPGALAGTETLTATASDAGTGITSVKIQYKRSIDPAWSDACTKAASPYTCTLDTTTLVEGAQYDFRAIATDGVSLSTTSAAIVGRTVDNTAPAITLTNPGSPIRGSVALASTATDGGSGVASVLYQYKLSSAATWSTACTAASSPWGCAWPSTGVTDNSYDLRATATDAAGNQTTSAAITARIVDNDQTPTGSDVQAANVGGGTAGKLEVGDSITFNFSEPIAPGSVVSGWSGAAAQAVVVRVDNNTTAGLDRLSVWNSTDTALTGLTADPAGVSSTRLFQNYVGAQAKFNANMTISGSTVTITFTSLRSGSVNGAAASTGTMQWVPTTALTDLAGNPLSVATVTETGALDRDF